jgi:hypothetical protein
MSQKIWAVVIGFLCLIIGYASLQTWEVQGGVAGKAVPLISQSFASTRIRPGETWKVYLNASDPSGEMKNFFAIINQPGVGQYPLSTIRIKKENRKELSGYLYLNTSTPVYPLNFVNLTLSVQVQDRSGNFGEPVVFSLSINSQFTQEDPPQGIFKEEALGPVMVRLKTVAGKH